MPSEHLWKENLEIHSSHKSICFFFSNWLNIDIWFTVSRVKTPRFGWWEFLDLKFPPKFADGAQEDQLTQSCITTGWRKQVIQKRLVSIFRIFRMEMNGMEYPSTGAGKRMTIPSYFSGLCCWYRRTFPKIWGQPGLVGHGLEGIDWAEVGIHFLHSSC